MVRFLALSNVYGTMFRINIFLSVISGHNFSARLMSNLDGVVTMRVTMRINSLSKLEIEIFIPQCNFLRNEYSNIGYNARWTKEMLVIAWRVQD